VIPVGDQKGVQELYVLRKRGGKMAQQSVLPVRFVPMTRRP
jgi:protein-L-isoaspartate O-methyltransferase